MGLASSITTALTGMQAAESQIDVIGNNLANSQTNGFKQSTIQFATQFLQTRSLGSSPTDNNGGTNPRQIGLGTRVNGITPEFTQGTIEVSANPSDLAIQGEGFFIVQGSQGERLYTRDGEFRTNAGNELVTANGNRVMGFGVDDSYQITTTTLKPITIPLGSDKVAQATQNVTLEGVLTPAGEIANVAEVIQSATLGDSAIPRPDRTGVTSVVAATPSIAAVTVANSEGGAGTHAEGSVYRYRFAFLDASGREGPASSELTVTVPAGNTTADDTITLNNLPTAGTEYSQVRIYRTDPGGSTFFQLGTAATGGSFTDNSPASSTTTLDTGTINGNYTYLITWARTGEEESRPSLQVGPVNVVNGRAHLSNLPSPPPGGSTFPTYDKVRIYRNLANDSNSFFLVGEVDPGQDFTDNRSDAAISDLSISTNKRIDLDGPRIDSNTLLTNIVRRSDFDYENLFRIGTLSFAGRKGGRELASKDFDISATTTVQDLLQFMNQAVGIQTTTLHDPQNPLTESLNTIAGETGTLAPGATIVDGKLRFTSNTGVDNALSIGLASFRMKDTTNNISTPNLGFGSVQAAKGTTAVADFIAYDSLGSPLNVRITTALESTSGKQTTYRWYADSPLNDPVTGASISVGTGLVKFDGEGKFVSATNDRVSVKRSGSPSKDPLEFKLDFSNVSGLAATKASLAASRQDGSGEGTLTSFIIGEDGRIRGVFSNGVSRDLGQLRLARFSNPSGLQQVGQTMFAQGVNSGLPIEGNPNQNGTGSVIAGARELSNTDIGKNLTDLVLASTTYRSNSRVITTAQQMLDELLNLRR